MNHGKLLIIEGSEGAGKSTLVENINEYFQLNGIKFSNVREPGGTPIAESIRTVFKADTCSEVMETSTELLLMYAARNQTIKHRVEPSLKEGSVVLCDRSWLSSYAYQQGINERDFFNIHDFIMKDAPSPDLVIYLDIEPEVGIERARGREALDRIEKRDISFFHTARTRYTYILREQFQQNHLIINTTNKTPQEVFSAVINGLIQAHIIPSGHSI